MKIDKILPLLKQIDKTVSQVRDLLFCPDGIRIVAVHRDELSYVEYWDGDLIPRILGITTDKVEEPVMQQWVFDAAGMISPMDYGKKQVELYTDIKEEELSLGVQATIDIFKIKVEDINDELLKSIRERNDFNNYLSEIERTSREFKKDSDACRDNGLSDSGSSTP